MKFVASPLQVIFPRTSDSRNPKLGTFAFLFLFLCLSPALVPAEETENLGAILDGFEAESPASAQEILQGFEDEDAAFPVQETTDAPPPSMIQVHGHTRVGASLNIAHSPPPAGRPDWRGLSRLKPELQLEAEADLRRHWQAFVSAKTAWDAVYGLRDRDRCPGPLLSRNESDVELREVWLRGRLGRRFDLKVGRQVLVWGKSDNIRVIDVLNPLDLREPGLTDIEDLRLPVAMARLDGYWGPWRITGAAIPEIRFNRMPAWGSDFYPSPAPLPPEEIPVDGAGNTEFALSLNGVFSGWDLSLVFADIYDDQAHLETAQNWPPTVARVHARLKMFGAAANWARGNWLLKTEAAGLRGLRFFNVPGRSFDRFDLLAGVAYSGFSEATVTLEAVSRRFLDFDRRIEAAPDKTFEEEFQSALRVSRDFLNETLNLTVLCLSYGATGQDGSLQRISVSYDLADALEITGGIVFYQSGDLPEMENIGDNDRIYSEIKYSF